MAKPDLPSSYATYPWKHILVSHHPPSSPTATPVVVITINRPEKGNAFTLGIQIEMIRALDFFDVDDRVKAIVVTGKGKLFCAGADLNIGLNREEGGQAKEHRDGGGKLVLAIHRCRKPTIAAMNGSAVGVGVTMTLPMAIRVVSATAKIGMVFARRGVVMEACSSFFLPRLIGYSQALYMTTTGAVVPASSPMLNGLFAEILPSPEQVLPRALEIATDVAQNTSTVSTYLMREMIWRNPGSAEGAHLLDSEIMFELYGKKDKEEGINSFLEKRPPRFEGSVDRDMASCVPWWSPVDVRVPRSSQAKL